MPVSADPERALAKMNQRSSFPMTKAQQNDVEYGQKHPIYIYNVSPIHNWPVQHQQLGILTIHKREWDQMVSRPLTVPGKVARLFDRGMRRMEWMIDDGMDVAEDICGCSKQYPAPEDSNRNLTEFGVFITIKPFEELSEKEQGKLISEATDKFINKCRQLVLVADQYHSQGNGKFIAQINRDALEALNNLTGSKEERPWAPILRTNRTEECQFCGHMNKPGIAKCANCHEITNQALYDKLTKGRVKA